MPLSVRYWLPNQYRDTTFTEGRIRRSKAPGRLYAKAWLCKANLMFCFEYSADTAVQSYEPDYQP